MNITWTIYRQLARAFPHEFKMAFGDDMLLAGEESMRRLAQRKGSSGFFRLLWDAALRLPIEYLAEMRQDTRYAMRGLIKSPVFALVAIVSMGLGIGLATNIYSSAFALLLRAIPGVGNASRLVTPQEPVSYSYIERFREHQDLFRGVAAVRNGVQFNVAVREHSITKPERVFGQIVSPDYFSVLGVVPQRGRVFSAEAYKPGATPAVVVTDRFWRSRLNADPNAVGQSLRINGQVATIIGITPGKFDGALSLNPAELFVPTTVPASLAPELSGDVLHQPFAKEFQALIGLQPGVTYYQAEAALDAIDRRLDKDDPTARPQEDHGKRVILLSAGARVPMPPQGRAVITAFYGALIAIVIAVACLNLATMLLARCAHRRKEFAIRVGVGASRFRLIRQMVTEGMLLSLAGGATGLVLAYGLWVVNLQVRQPAGMPMTPDLSMDWHAVMFALVVALICGIGFSLAPALQSTRTNIGPALKEGAAQQLSGNRRFGFRNLAIGAQVAGSLMLILITGFLVLGILNGSTVQTSFDKNTMGFLSVDPVRDGYTPEQSGQFLLKLNERLRGTGRLSSFAFAAQAPFINTDSQGAVALIADGSRAQQSVSEMTVGPGYFLTMGTSLLAGREFQQRDLLEQNSGVPAPLILNRKAARALFSDSNAIGKRLHDLQRAYQVVGVVPDSKDARGAIAPFAYVALTQRDFLRPPAGGITILARSSSAADALNAMRDAAGSLDPNIMLFNAQTLNEYLELSRFGMRAALRTYAGIGLFGLILSAIGLSGVTAYAVAQRSKEIGIRMVLGARKGQVLRLVLREGVTLIAAGSLVGFLGAAVLARVLSSITTSFGEALQEGINDPRLLLGAPLLLGCLALMACYLPARKAMKLDPVQALRQE
jgi:macrolide transport system ATP-binding/permease protein